MSNTKSTKKENKKTPAETAYTYLASRMRTSEEVRKHLYDKGFSQDEIQETINDLIGLRYIDDYQFALRYYEYNREKKRGSLRASRELAEKGIDQETIRNAREDFLYSQAVDEFEDAFDIAKRELSLKTFDNPGASAPDLSDSKISSKIARKLENKGFSHDIIFRVLERLRSSDWTM